LSIGYKNYARFIEKVVSKKNKVSQSTNKKVQSTVPVSETKSVEKRVKSGVQNKQFSSITSKETPKQKSTKNLSRTRKSTTSIVVDKASVEFPLLDIKAKSLRHVIMRKFGYKSKWEDRLNKLRNEGLTQFRTKEEDLKQLGARFFQDESGFISVRALEKISLILKKGDRIGLLGRNGAGKTTLLRLLAGIYEPVSGEIKINGAVTPMFALEAGMDPDATGYENIRLRAQLLGLTNEEIDHIQEEIADFTGLGDYLNVPIRTYSSGMMVRLSFGCATALRPEILLMDEMIGAGDAAFIEEANDRLENFVGAAGIMVVATHNPGILQEWCNKGILLEKGRVKAVGEVDDVIDLYDRDLQLVKGQ
tara:strand:- start:2708 stop:3796 length:1089 start_codon:yes stop_codon:yes gene_type:complete